MKIHLEPTPEEYEVYHRVQSFIVHKGLKKRWAKVSDKEKKEIGNRLTKARINGNK